MHWRHISRIEPTGNKLTGPTWRVHWSRASVSRLHWLQQTRTVGAQSVRALWTHPVDGMYSELRFANSVSVQFSSCEQTLMLISKTFTVFLPPVRKRSGLVSTYAIATGFPLNTPVRSFDDDDDDDDDDYYDNVEFRNTQDDSDVISFHVYAWWFSPPPCG